MATSINNSDFTPPVAPGATNSAAFRPTLHLWYNGKPDRDTGKCTKILDATGPYTQFEYGQVTLPDVYCGPSRRPPKQVALICTRKTKLVVIDVDDPEAFATSGIPLSYAHAMTVRGHGHFHIALDYRAVPDELWPPHGHFPGGEIISAGFVPFPYSRHYSGARYELMPGWAAPLPVNEDLARVILAARRGVARNGAAPGRSGGALAYGDARSAFNNALTSVMGRIVQLGWPEDQAREAVRHLNDVSDDPISAERFDGTIGKEKGWEPGEMLTDEQLAYAAGQAADPGPAPVTGTVVPALAKELMGVPSAAPQDGASLLDELLAAFTKYVQFPSPEAAVAAVLWTAATHAQTSWEHATRLVVKSPERRCGKSRLLDVIEATCCIPLLTVNISPAALVRCISEAAPPTLLLDEADTVFGRKAADGHEDLRGIINAGHQRGRPYIRWDVQSRSPESCPTFAMAALAAIGDLPDTIEDRAVIILMRRRARGEEVRPFRTRRDGVPLGDLRSRIGKWAEGIAADLARAEPEIPVEDRAADNWEPLLAIADAAGGAWPGSARRACLELCAADGTADDTLGIRLLADLRIIFGSETGMSTARILACLCTLEESPWRGSSRRDGIEANRLAALLRPYGVHSVKARYGTGQSPVAGYKLECTEAKCKRPACGLADAWRRYLPPAEES